MEMRGERKPKNEKKNVRRTRVHLIRRELNITIFCVSFYFSIIFCSLLFLNFYSSFNSNQVNSNEKEEEEI